MASLSCRILDGSLGSSILSIRWRKSQVPARSWATSMPRPCSFVLLLMIALPAPAQDSRPRIRAELARLWQEQRYADLSRRAAAHLLESPQSADVWIMAGEAALKLED